MLIGNPNKIVNKIGTSLMLNDRIGKLLYYSDKPSSKYKDVDKLSSLENPIEDLKNKYFFYNRRINKILQKSSGAMFLRVGELDINNNPKIIGGIETVYLELGIVCHIDYLETVNGNRILCLVDSVQEELKNFSELGHIRIVRALPIRDVPIEYEGFILYIEVTDYNEHELDK